MHSHTATLLSLLLLLPFGIAHAGAQADAFANIYATTCLKHLSNLEALRSKLKNMPELPSEKATFFLQGNPGNAWPVPDKNGVFVLAVPSNKNICLVYAHRVIPAEAEALFQKIVEKAPEPLTSRKVQDEKRQTTANGPTRTISYEWSVANAPRKMLFTLTTASGQNPKIQGLASAAYVQ